MRRRVGRFFGLAALVLLVAACGNNAPGPDSSPAEVAQAVYRHDGPPELALYTMINNRSGNGAHTSLLVNGSQRVIFDPAGSVRFSTVPEQDDVLYGITPTVRDAYERAHARETFHVRIQRLQVTPEVAEAALRLAQSNGKVSAAFCASATSALLQRLPGFEGIRSTMFPNNLADQFAQIPGVQERLLFEDDADDKAVAIAEFEARTGETGTGQTQTGQTQAGQ